ncbi:MAG: hypothetical protein JXA22_07445, partial [Candidatus Thermoplasmatota archaeon]|nr:hypothetical protein [Candidatus Thermoplasmatota archaeon]
MDHVREERRETKVTIKVARVPVMCDHERDRVEDLYNDHLYDGLESGVKPGDARCDTDLSRPYF